MRYVHVLHILYPLNPSKVHEKNKERPIKPYNCPLATIRTQVSRNNRTEILDLLNKMTSSPPLVWFITGCSSGIGAALAIHILKAGHKVIATARNLSSAASFSEIKSLGGH
jgi:3-oxoacyl-ACP reductase-like protein